MLRHGIRLCTHRRKAKGRSRKGVQVKGSDTDDLHLGSHTLTRNCSLNLVCVCLSAFFSLISYQFPAYNAMPCMCPNPSPQFSAPFPLPIWPFLASQCSAPHSDPDSSLVSTALLSSVSCPCAVCTMEYRRDPTALSICLKMSWPTNSWE